MWLTERQVLAFALALSLMLLVIIAIGWPLGWWQATFERFSWYPPSTGLALLGLVLLLGVLLALRGWRAAAIIAYGAVAVTTVMQALGYLVEATNARSANTLQVGTAFDVTLHSNPVMNVIATAIAVAGILSVVRRGPQVYTALVSSVFVATLAIAPSALYGVGAPLTPMVDTVVNPIPPLLMCTLGLAVAAANPSLPPITWLLHRTSGVVIALVLSNIVVIPILLRWIPELLGGGSTAQGLVYVVVVFLVLIEFFVAAMALADRERWSQITEVAADAVLVADADGRIVEANESATTVMRATMGQVVGSHLADWLPPADRHKEFGDAQAWRANPRQVVSVPGETFLRAADGALVPIEYVKAPVMASGKLFAVLSIRDASLLTVLRSENEEVRALLADATDKSPVGQVLAAPDLCITRATASAVHVLGGKSADEIVGKDLLDFIAISGHDTAIAVFGGIPRGESDSAEADLPLRRLDGQPAWGHIVARALRRSDGELMLSLQVFDITDRVSAERLAAEALADLEYRSTHDPLTDLPNRVLAVEAIDALLGKRDRVNPPFAVLYCDLDNFKFINDEYSHEVGDNLLVQLSRRLRQRLGAEELLGRISGDEFVIVLPTSNTAQDAKARADDLIRLIAVAPFSVGLGRVFTSLTVGIAMSTPHATAEDLLRDADLALYAAKGDGRGRARLFDEPLRHESERRVNIARGIGDALAEGRITAWYQPVIRLVDNTVVGFEALARWQTDEEGEWAASSWISIADEVGLLAPVGEQILDEVIAMLPRLPEQLWVAVNVAGSQISLASAETWLARLAAADIAPRRLVIEVLEQSLAHAPESVREAMELLTEAGVRIFFDDFGTGHTSIATLGMLPMSGIKLDRSFTARFLEGNRHDFALASALATMAATLRLETIAEGIETSQQARTLRAAGWEYGQGWYYGHPTPEPNITNSW